MLLWGGAGSSSIDQAEGHKEEWMEEYEVDLRDYFRVIWRKKWIILGVFLAAILIASLVSFRSPSQYRAEAVVRVNPLPEVGSISIPSPSPEMLLALLRSSDLLRQLAEESGLAGEEPFRGLSSQELIEWLADHLKGNLIEKTSLIRLELSGPLDPGLLTKILDRCLQSLRERLKGDIVSDVGREIDRISLEIIILEEQRTKLIQEVEGKIAEQKAILEKQREELLQQLSAIEADKTKLQLQAGEQSATLEGVVLREKFIALNNRLQQVEQGIIDLELKGREMFPYLNARIGELDRQLAELEVTRSEAYRLFDSGWEPVYVLSKASASSSPVGPNRSMNLAVAGVLGLFVGVLLAFFIHYIEGGKQTEAKE
jgi:uncharacterized protein involved in exopolysaccharide biosynthesis